MVMNFIKNPNDYFKNFKALRIAANSSGDITDSQIQSEINEALKGFNPGTKGLEFNSPMKKGEINGQPTQDDYLNH